MSDALLPCPFCGGRGQLMELFAGFCGECVKCESTGPAGETEPTAIAAWNSRATPAEVAALRARVERLEVALRECADDLEAYVMREYSGEVLTRGNVLRRARDLAPVDAARAALEDRP